MGRNSPGVVVAKVLSFKKKKKRTFTTGEMNNFERKLVPHSAAPCESTRSL